MNLHVDTYGSGAPLLLIHGWGMHGGMWGGVAEKLAQYFRVMAVDLPGHGYSGLPSPAGGGGVGGEGSAATALSLTLVEQLAIRLSPHAGKSLVISRSRERGLDLLDAIVDQLSSQFTEPLAVCGWSLGGQVALRWAQREPQKIERLILVASTPRFVQAEDWPHALSVEILEGFADSLQRSYQQTLKRFLSLQMRGSDNERETLAHLRDVLFSRGEPDLSALQFGLDTLRDTDLRRALPEVMLPTLVIAGERDTLMPHGAAEYLASQLPNGRLVTIKGAAHAPFLSHPEMFVEQVKGFLA